MNLASERGVHLALHAVVASRFSVGLHALRVDP